MTKVIVYHGTTRAHAINILAGREKSDVKITWNCSDDDYLYVWTAHKLYGYDEDQDHEDYDRQAIQRAFENAQITAAVQDEPQKELVVLAFEVEYDDVEDDVSCDGMDEAARIRLENYAECHVKTLVCKHNPRLDGVIVSNLLDNPHLTSNISDDLIEAAKAFKDVWLDSLLEFDYREDNA